MTTNESTLGKRLRKLRAARGLSQDDVARGVGVRGLAVGRWERDEANPSYENRLALARFFKVDPAEVGVEVIESNTGTEPPAWAVEMNAKLDRILEIVEHL